MSTSIVMPAQGPFQSAFSMLTKFIDMCPEEIWEETNGGWPVWQQIVHMASIWCFFVDQEGAAPLSPPCGSEVARLAVQGTTPVSKARARAYAEQCKIRVDNYLGRLTDAKLTDVNEALTKRIGFPILHVVTLTMLSSHTLYHLGSCDAALRDHGISGVF